MLIQLKKGKDKADTLACIRDDGTSTGTDLSPHCAYHDIAHYAVEKLMGFREGFYGMIARGIDIADYEKPNQERGFQIPPEGYYAEFLASLIQAAVHLGKVDPAYVQMLKEGAGRLNLPFPEMPPAGKLDQMREMAASLVRKWEMLEPGQSLELEL